jgi:hypothetical protein
MLEVLSIDPVDCQHRLFQQAPQPAKQPNPHQEQHPATRHAVSRIFAGRWMKVRGSHSEWFEELFFKEVFEWPAGLDFYQVRSYGVHHVVVQHVLLLFWGRHEEAAQLSGRVARCAELLLFGAVA